MVLDDLNAQRKSLALWFPADVSTSAQATIGGMTGNNSCGSRSIFYGNMVHNVAAIDALLADGTTARFDDAPDIADNVRFTQIVDGVRAICERADDEIAARFLPLLRRVAGDNLDIFNPYHPMRYNMALPNLT